MEHRRFTKEKGQISIAAAEPPPPVSGGLPPSPVSGGLPPSPVSGGIPHSSEHLIIKGGLDDLCSGSVSGGLPPSPVSDGLPPSPFSGGIPHSSEHLIIKGGLDDLCSGSGVEFHIAEPPLPVSGGLPSPKSGHLITKGPDDSCSGSEQNRGEFHIAEPPPTVSGRLTPSPISGRLSSEHRSRGHGDGAMEYKLENADLVNIRRDAGVTDPYWVPPPGWTPGDSPTQDPICARELKVLKDGFSKMEREMNEIASSKKSQEEENNQAITVVGSKTRHSDTSQRLDPLAISLGSSICEHGSGHVPEEKLSVATPPSVNSSTAALAKPPHQLLVKPLAEKRTVKVTMSTNYSHEGDAKNYSSISASALINLNNAPPKFNAMPLEKLEQSTVRNEEPLLLVPTLTQPSVNSSTAALAKPPHQLLVKPLAEKRTVKVTMSTNYSHEGDAKNYSSNSASALINLNNAPPKFNAIPLRQVSPNASTSPIWESDPKDHLSAERYKMAVETDLSVITAKKPIPVPLPGWKPSDSLNRDPICAGELKVLEDGFRNLMAKQIQLGDEIGKLRREINEVAASKSRSQEVENNLAITVVGSKTSHSDISQRLDRLAISSGSSICDLGSSAQEKLEQSTVRNEEPLLLVPKLTPPPVNSSTAALAEPPRQHPVKHLTTGTTILSYRRNRKVLTSSDGRATLTSRDISSGNIKKLRKIADKYLAMFAGFVNEGKHVMSQLEKFVEGKIAEGGTVTTKEIVDFLTYFIGTWDAYPGEIGLVDCSGDEPAIYHFTDKGVEVITSDLYGIGSGAQDAMRELNLIFQQIGEENLANMTDDQILDLLTCAIVKASLKRHCTGGFFLQAISDATDVIIRRISHLIDILSGMMPHVIEGSDESLFVSLVHDMGDYGSIVKKRNSILGIDDKGKKADNGVDDVHILGQDKEKKIVVWLAHTNNKFPDPPLGADCPLVPGVWSRLSEDNLKHVAHEYFLNIKDEVVV